MDSTHNETSTNTSPSVAEPHGLAGSPPSHSSSAPASKKPLIIAGIAVLLVVYAIGTFFVIRNFTGKDKKAETTQTANAATAATLSLSGAIGINGAPPAGATVSIGVRKAGSTAFETVVSDISPFDGAVWHWNGPKQGEAYDIKAVMNLNGQQIGASQILTAVAPADGENLEINVSSTAVNTNGAGTGANTAAAISGMFNLNGYIPSNATISIQTRSQGGTFNTILSSATPTDNGAWSWTSATQNTTYDIQALLVVNGQTVAQSQILTATAPAHGEILTINSTLPSPGPTTGTISGSFNINGNMPSGATLSLGTRITDSNAAFTMVSTNISPVDNSTWAWNQAQIGTSYDIQAYVIVNGNVVSSSPVLSVAAPATGETLTINGQNQPSAPPNGSLLYACTATNGNQWQVRFTMNNNSVVNNAVQYQVSAGTSSGDSSLVNVTVDPPNPGQAQDYTTGFVFNTGQTYFAQWAYATCSNCGTFSQVSSSISFTCNNPTATPVPSATTVPSSTTVPSTVPSSTTAPTNTSAPTYAPPTSTTAPTNTVAPTAVSSPTGPAALSN